MMMEQIDGVLAWDAVSAASRNEVDNLARGETMNNCRLPIIDREPLGRQLGSGRL